ncbi:hypothetical protein I3F58_14010 [Streptomyces sp. MUM 203J]|uniref:hypothetical protein n=1 Tax=Streptomyces sp. MUM 203J TaxID=2791990 RepID=UPI001F03AFE5|nr:hypothetical protein [Streptomyces sp. MUM 203J]MCH0540664.1 hypothetical protein [Streptomyces sp. MUM 203J]
MMTGDTGDEGHTDGSGRTADASASYFALGMCSGTGIGTALGVALGNIPVGVALGAGIGAVFGLMYRGRDGTKEDSGR